MVCKCQAFWISEVLKSIIQSSHFKKMFFFFFLNNITLLATFVRLLVIKSRFDDVVKLLSEIWLINQDNVHMITLKYKKPLILTEVEGKPFIFRNLFLCHKTSTQFVEGKENHGGKVRLGYIQYQKKKLIPKYYNLYSYLFPYKSEWKENQLPRNSLVCWVECSGIGVLNRKPTSFLFLLVEYLHNTKNKNW